MTPRPKGHESGAAVLELVAFMMLLFALLVLLSPLTGIIREQLKLSRTAGRTVRFATSAPDSVRRSCSGIRLARRPSVADVAEEASCSHFGARSVSPEFSVAVSAAPSTLAPGARLSVTVSNQVDLGLTGSLLSIVGIDETYSRPTLSATAVAIEE